MDVYFHIIGHSIEAASGLGLLIALAVRDRTHLDQWVLPVCGVLGMVVGGAISLMM